MLQSGATPVIIQIPHPSPRRRKSGEEGRRERVPQVTVKEGESIEGAIRRFKRKCEKAGVLSELKKRQHYEKPSVQEKKKKAAAKKRLIKKMRKSRVD